MQLNKNATQLTTCCNKTIFTPAFSMGWKRKKETSAEKCLSFMLLTPSNIWSLCTHSCIVCTAVNINCLGNIDFKNAKDPAFVLWRGNFLSTGFSINVLPSVWPRLSQLTILCFDKMPQLVYQGRISCWQSAASRFFLANRWHICKMKQVSMLENSPLLRYD